MSPGYRALVAGATGMVVALGIAELVHGLYALVPSVPVTLSQRIIELTPGALATAGIGALGKAAAPILVAVVVVSALLSAAVLAVLALRSRVAVSLGVAALGGVALLAAFAEPFIAPVATVLTVLGALAAGTLICGLLLRSSRTPSRRSGMEPDGEEAAERREPEPFSGRYREAHAGGGIAVNRRGFLALAGGAAAAGAAAAGTGRFLTGEEDAEIAGAKPL